MSTSRSRSTRCSFAWTRAGISGRFMRNSVPPDARCSFDSVVTRSSVATLLGAVRTAERDEAEELVFDLLRRRARAVDGHERRVAPPAVPVNRPREHLPPRASLAIEHDRAAARRDPGQQLDDLPDRGGGAEHAVWRDLHAFRRSGRREIRQVLRICDHGAQIPRHDRPRQHVEDASTERVDRAFRARGIDDADQHRARLLGPNTARNPKGFAAARVQSSRQIAAGRSRNSVRDLGRTRRPAHRESRARRAPVRRLARPVGPPAIQMIAGGEPAECDRPAPTCGSDIERLCLMACVTAGLRPCGDHWGAAGRKCPSPSGSLSIRGAPPSAV